MVVKRLSARWFTPNHGTYSCILYDCLVIYFSYVLDSMSYVWGVAFGKEIGADKTPRSLSARLVLSVFAFVVLILANSYSANLMAFLVQDNFLLPIEGIKDPKVCKWFS